MRVRVAVLLLCLASLQVVVACGGFGAASSDGAGPDPGTPDGSQIGDGAPVADAPVDAGADGPSDDGATCPHLRCLTFEQGLTGFDSKSGSPARTTEAPPKGTGAMAVDGVEAFIIVDAGERADLWLSFYMRVVLAETAVGEAVPFEIFAADGTLVVMGFLSGPSSAPTLSVEVGGNRVELYHAITPGTVYRCGVHVKRGDGGLAVEGVVAVGDAPFGLPIAVEPAFVSDLGPARVLIGSAGIARLSAVFDDVFLSTAAMPPPSP